MNQMIEEKFLIERAQSGDKDAFCELISVHESKIYALSFRYMQNEHDALDAAQDAILKIYLNIAKFKMNSAFSTWVYRVVVNACLDIIRKRKNTVEFAEYQGGSSGDYPADALVAAEFMEGLKKSIGLLPEKLKNVIVLKDLEHKKYDEIAVILGISEGTVKSRLFRAREKLKKSMEMQGLL